jgi:hypothetical protein
MNRALPTTAPPQISPISLTKRPELGVLTEKIAQKYQEISMIACIRIA